MAGPQLRCACGEICFIITSSLPDGSGPPEILAKSSDGTTDITLCPQKTWDDEVGLEELLEKEEMPSTMLMPCPSQGTDSMGKAGPMQSVGHDSMVRADNV